MVLAPVADRLQVAHRVVPLGVDHVEERRDGGEGGGKVVEQRLDARHVLLAEDHDDHHLARRGRTDNHVAHQAAVLAGVMERIAVLHAEALRLEADGVRGLGLEPAAVDVEHLVEHARDVEAHGGRGVELRTGGHLLVGEPAAVGEGEFELVAVELRAGRPQAGGNLGQFDLADARELVAHLLALEAQLLVVGQVLPLAAAADTEVFAEGLHTQRRAAHVADHVTLHVAAALGPNLDVDHVARYGHRDEDHLFVPAPHRLAFGGERRYFESLEQRVIGFFACHKVSFSLLFGRQR